MNKYCFQFLKDGKLRNKNIEAESINEAIHAVHQMFPDPVSWYHKRFVADGKTYNHLDSEFDSFDVCGVLRRGGRFTSKYKKSFSAFGVNLWHGSVWGVREYASHSGKLIRKRTLLKRVYN